MQKVIYPEHLEFSMDNDLGFLQANAFEDLEAYTFLILVRVRKGSLTLDIGHDTRVSYVIKRKKEGLHSIWSRAREEDVLRPFTSCPQHHLRIQYHSVMEHFSHSKM